MKISITVTELWHIQEYWKKSKRHNSKIKKGEQSFLCRACRPDLIHIPVMFHEDILNGKLVMAHIRIFGIIIKRA